MRVWERRETNLISPTFRSSKNLDWGHRILSQSTQTWTLHAWYYIGVDIVSISCQVRTRGVILEPKKESMLKMVKMLWISAGMKKFTNVERIINAFLNIRTPVIKILSNSTRINRKNVKRNCTHIIEFISWINGKPKETKFA